MRKNRKSILLVQSRCIPAVDVVPPITAKVLLVEYRPVSAQERRALVAFTSIVAHMVNLSDKSFSM